jgi:orc1/cdc6 family replication initiation protein
MICDARVFRHDFRPKDLQHRHDTLRRLSSHLEPVTSSRPVDPISLFGPTGVGKTVAAKVILDQLRGAVLDLDATRVNCWSDHSRFDVLHKLLEETGAPTHDLRRDRTPREDMLHRFQEHVDGQCVVVLDEVDQLDDEDLLYDLFRTDGVSLVFIANRREDVFGDLDDRLQSRLLTTQIVEFDPYSVAELVDILRVRADRGLDPGAVGASELQAIGERAQGDARVAIQALKNAADSARQRGAEAIGADDIEDAVAAARQEIRQKTKSNLTRHQRVLYELIREAGELRASELHEAYEEAVEEPRTRRQRRNYLSKLEHYHLVESEGETRWKTYRVVGNCVDG